MRVVAYVPQILKAAADKNGASSISAATWLLFLVAHLSTVAYALVNRSDSGWPRASQSTRCAVRRSWPSPIGNVAPTAVACAARTPAWRCDAAG
jgi:hypothetical protein